jgi:hypothetical protein
MKDLKKPFQHATSYLETNMGVEKIGILLVVECSYVVSPVWWQCNSSDEKIPVGVMFHK